MNTVSRDRLAPLASPSGAFAMVALDQREAMRAMFAEYQDEPVTDGQITDFKVRAARALSPFSSGLLLDRQFALDGVLAAGALTPGCGLIVAADHFVPDARELGALGADLYKARVPLHGRGPEAAIRRRCAELTGAIGSPWVVLSSGVHQDDFPRAVRLACLEGASGFLAGLVSDVVRR